MSYSSSFFDKLRENSQSKFEYVRGIMNYAITTIKNFLANDERYDTANWKVCPNRNDQNIISGVLKEGKAIMILIRPTNGNKVIFHREQEKNVLTLDTSELWGCSDQH